MFVALTSATAVADSSRIPLTIPGECPIGGYSYQFSGSSARGVPNVTNCASYVPGDTVPSQYSDPSIEARVMAGFNAMPRGNDRTLISRLRRSNIVLIAEYQIGESPDVTILKYGIGTAWNGVTAFAYAAYVKSADDVFPLANDTPSQLRGLNELLAEHKGALNLSPTCCALLAASLYSSDGPLIVLDSQSDIATAARINKALNESADFQRVFNVETLFRINTGQDSILQRALRGVQADDMAARLSRVSHDLGVAIDPLRVSSGPEDDTVTFVAYEMGRGGFSQWSVVVSKLGFVRHIENPRRTSGVMDVGLGRLMRHR